MVASATAGPVLTQTPRWRRPARGHRADVDRAAHSERHRIEPGDAAACGIRDPDSVVRRRRRRPRPCRRSPTCAPRGRGRRCTRVPAVRIQDVQRAASGGQAARIAGHVERRARAGAPRVDGQQRPVAGERPHPAGERREATALIRSTRTISSLARRSRQRSVAGDRHASLPASAIPSGVTGATCRARRAAARCAGPRFPRPSGARRCAPAAPATAVRRPFPARPTDRHRRRRDRRGLRRRRTCVRRVPRLRSLGRCPSVRR